MINHVRALLLNKSNVSAGLDSGNPGAELIDKTFNVVNLPQVLGDIKQAFLPESFTPYQENCILAYIMRILHAPELLDYTLALDPRYTYSLDTDYITRLRQDAVELESSNTGDTVFAYRYYDTVKWPHTGSVLTWDIRYDDTMGSQISVAFLDREANMQTARINGGYTQYFTLVANHLAFRLETPSDALTGVFRHKLTFFAPVELDVSALLARLKVLDGTHSITTLLFSTWGAYDVLLSDLRQIWLNSEEPFLQVGVVLLAYALQVERLRQGLALPIRSSSIRRLT